LPAFLTLPLDDLDTEPGQSYTTLPTHAVTRCIYRVKMQLKYRKIERHF